MGRRRTGRPTEAERVHVSRRRAEAVELHLAGRSYVEIGRALAESEQWPRGYDPHADDENLAAIVKTDIAASMRLAARAEGVKVEPMRRQTEERLERLIAAWWDAATTERLIRDPRSQATPAPIMAVQPTERAALVVLRALADLRALRGLDAPVKAAIEVTDSTTASVRAREAAEALIAVTQRVTQRARKVIDVEPVDVVARAAVTGGNRPMIGLPANPGRDPEPAESEHGA